MGSCVGVRAAGSMGKEEAHFTSQNSRIDLRPEGMFSPFSTTFHNYI